jgi:hypothetical protein
MSLIHEIWDRRALRRTLTSWTLLDIERQKCKKGEDAQERKTEGEGGGRNRDIKKGTAAW